MCPFSSLHPLGNGKKRQWKKNKFTKYLKKVREKKKSCHLVPKVVIDLPFEGRKVEGSQKYRRREETVTELINFCIGEFHTIVVSK